MPSWPPIWPRRPGGCCWRCATRSATTSRPPSAMPATSAPTRCCCAVCATERPGDAVLSEEAHDDLPAAARRPGVDHRPTRRHPRVFDAPPRGLGRPRGALAAHPDPMGRHHHRRRGGAARSRRGAPQRHRDRPAAPPSGPIRITASSNRPPAVLWLLRDRLDIEFIRIGSAGAKAMAVLRGDADAYIHAGGQWEWDSAAPAGVLQAAGSARHPARRLAAALQPARSLPARPADVPSGDRRPAARRDVAGELMRGLAVASTFPRCPAGVRSCGSTTAPTGRSGPPCRDRRPPCTSAASPRMTPPISATPPPT